MVNNQDILGMECITDIVIVVGISTPSKIKVSIIHQPSASHYSSRDGNLEAILDLVIPASLGT
jgi:hypothetical protein